MLSIETLQQRRKHACILFVYDILTGRIWSDKLLSSLLNFYVPPRSLRNNNALFRVGNCRTIYASFEPVKNISILFNEVNYLFDFNESLLSFKINSRLIGSQDLNEATEWAMFLHYFMFSYIFWKKFMNSINGDEKWGELRIRCEVMFLTKKYKTLYIKKTIKNILFKNAWV